MRIEIVLIIVVGLILANIYTEGKFVKKIFQYKKYLQMAGILLGALILYWMLKKNPYHARQILSSSNEYLKYLPVDRNTSNMISPILDFTTKYIPGGSVYQGGQQDISEMHPILSMSQPSRNYAEQRIVNSGKKSTKRSVSETKKKFVAARQNWHCGNCQKQLPAWFEVDHKIRLEHGGSNHIDNLVALCRDCHGEKTAIENL